MSGSHTPDRRSVIVAGAALLGSVALPGAGAAADEGLAPAGDLLGKVRAFLSGLEPDKRKAASFAWNGAEWRGWNYFGATGYIKPGLRLEQMSGGQKESAWDVLGTVWSPSGVAKARNVMLLQDILAASGNGAGQRSSERFSLAVFGTPAETGAWGFRCEGHHLTQSVAVRDNRIVSVTPSSFSAIPNRVKSGPHTGLNTLKDEEGLARRLMADLTPKLQGRARIGDSTPYNILSYAGRERANAKKVGLVGLRAVVGAARSALEDDRALFGRAFPGAAFGRAAGARAIRRPAGRAFRLVRRQHAGDGVRLSRDRRRLRHRDGVGGRRGAAPAHDLSRSRQCAGAERMILERLVPT